MLATFLLAGTTTALTAAPAAAACRQKPAELTFSAGSVIAGSGTTGRIRLACTARSAVTVAVSADSPQGVVPAAVTIPAGTTSTSFAVGTLVDASQTEARFIGVRATLGSDAATATLLVYPPPPPAGAAVAALDLSASTVVGGSDPVTATVTLTRTAAADTVVAFYGSAYGPVQLPPTVTIAAGQRSATAQLLTRQVDEDFAYSLTAEVTGTPPVGAPLEITPGPFAVTLAATALLRGNTTTGTLTIPAARTSETVIRLATDATGIAVPDSVTIPAGATATTFRVSVSGTAGGPGSLQATSGGVDKFVFFFVL
jgi:hypothetical protein